jgi:Flp pilus assembly pilin Flp
MLFTMAQEFAPQYSSKVALYIVGGATTLKDRVRNQNLFTEKADALAAANA